MKPVLAVLVLLILSTGTAKSQLEKIDVLINATESEVISYLDSLNKLRPNPSYKIERSVTKGGSLQLSSSFSVPDQDFYKCLNLVFVFQRVNGMEFCTQRVLSGYPKNAESNLNFVKDNFTSIAPNSWQKQMAPGHTIQARFGLVEGKEETFYYLQYFSQKKN